MIHSRSLAVLALALVGLYWAPPSAEAATTCTTSTTPLAFGTVTGAANADSNGSVTITCNTFGLSLAAGVRVRMCLYIGDGVNGPGHFNPRRMTNTFGDPLQFQIYRDAARSQTWGNGSFPAPLQVDLQYSVPLLGGSGSITANLFGRVFAQPGLAAGSYSNPFMDGHTWLEYRYAESIFGTPNWPGSCSSGGTGGGSTTFPFTASATVPNNCVISAATNLDFGTVPGLINANRDQTSAISFTCTGRTAWNVALNNGQNASGSTRRMRLGASGSYVNYELYRDPGRSQRWGTTAGADTVPGTGTGSVQTLTVYGRVPATQAVPAGNYGDVITVTVSY
ncbi:spore coat U domain-containing protein [Luteimonas salinilitoris]|uniref:Spore coat U domain-containing protein n=1 Tax=Luteimonas salinilitoris TaxID=3237697 RepID=A0ABV4HWF5_9GAMM